MSRFLVIGQLDLMENIMTTPAVRPRMTRTRLIGFFAMAVCAVGYVGAGLALWVGKIGQMDMSQAALAAAGLAVVGEVGLGELDHQAARVDAAAHQAERLQAVDRGGVEVGGQSLGPGQEGAEDVDVRRVQPGVARHVHATPPFLPGEQPRSRPDAQSSPGVAGSRHGMFTLAHTTL